ncbi:MAG: right-handed parallel beta-helix repeat-containing protein [Phycisphaerae bacterium]|nr:right-handed parallel beta-helix repeat-containing protein [Phycisphaerae bacterium]
MKVNANLLRLSIILLGLACTVAAGDVIYVDTDAPPEGDGSSWASALNSLQDGLLVASSGDEIWVAEGTYKPDEGGTEVLNDREAAFELINGVGIYGGFVGTETSLEQRDWENNVTTLSGDINAPGDNSYNVVTGSETDATTVLDGFTIRDGTLAGIDCNTADPTITNCVITYNGTGISGIQSNLEVTNCVLKYNEYDGIYNFYASMTVADCIFQNNGANGIYTHTGNLAVMDCDFVNNVGRGVYFSAYGGSATYVRCAFIGNTGGGLYNGNKVNGNVYGCIFVANSAEQGGGLYMGAYAGHQVINCTFVGNSATLPDSGGAMHIGGVPSGCYARNSIFWNNGDLELYNSDPVHPIAAFDMAYCNVDLAKVEGSVIDNGGNINSDPLFVDANDVHLAGPGSPCFNVGDPNFVPVHETDIDGDWRLMYGRVDMGADEVFTIAGDFEPDKDVDGFDLDYLAEHWLNTPCVWPDWCEGADINRDGTVNSVDYAYFAGNWLASVE